MELQRMRHARKRKTEFGDRDLDMPFAAIAVDVVNPLFALFPPAEWEFYLVRTVSWIPIIVDASESVPVSVDGEILNFSSVVPFVYFVDSTGARVGPFAGTDNPFLTTFAELYIRYRQIYGRFAVPFTAGPQLDGDKPTPVRRVRLIPPGRPIGRGRGMRDQN
jgi:hypothetical protein